MKLGAIKKYPFAIIGVILFLSAFTVYPICLSIVMLVDSTPPIISNVIPANGITYNPSALTTISCRCYDAESGIASVSATVDGSTYSTSLPFTSGDSYSSALYSKTYGGPTAAGSHTFGFTVVNGVGLSTSISGTFYFYVALTGTWTVAGTTITGSSQTITSTSMTIPFSFTQTAGSGTPTCTVSWSGPSSGSITLTKSGSTWSGSYTFSTGGTYTVTPTASDGTTTVTFTIVDLGIPVTGFVFPQLSTQAWLMIASGTCFAVEIVRRKIHK